MRGAKQCEAEGCLRTFEPRTVWQRFCSLTCKDKVRHRRDRATRLAGSGERYRRNPERTKAAALLSLAQKKARVQELKNVPCADCQERYPFYVMDFDHVRGEKYGSVGAMLATGYAIKTIEAEIAKCEVVCANCHRERTHARKVAQDSRC